MDEGSFELIELETPMIIHAVKPFLTIAAPRQENSISEKDSENCPSSERKSPINNFNLQENESEPESESHELSSKSLKIEL